MYRLLSLTLGSFLIAFGAFAQESGAASDTRAQQTRFVDDTGVDAGDCTDPENPCATVGFAVQQAGNGDIIAIAEGAYTEPLTLDKSLTLKGAGQSETSLQTRRLPAPTLGHRVVTIGPGLVINIADVTINRGIASSNSKPQRLGGGIYNEGSVLNLTNVTLRGNMTRGGGGGGVANVNASGTFSNVTFRSNAAGSSDGKGGGLLNIGSDLVLTNVVFTANDADFGGGMYNMESSPTLTNVTFHNNIAPLVGGGIYNADQSAPTLRNTIVWGHLNGGDEGREIFNEEDSSIELHFSLYDNGPGAIVEGGGFEATNSLTSNPLFVRPWRGNLRLRDTSPAIDAGDPNTDLALFPVNEKGVPVDLDGNPRVFGEAIDIGAYENQHQGAPVAAIDASSTTPADVLSAPSPNPVHGTASFTLAVEYGQNVSVEVYDALGRRVRTLFDGALTAEVSETLSLDASGLPAGVYMIRATGEDFVKTRRVTVIR